MNEHDSERIAGSLVQEGLSRASGIDDADVVVLNTCCVRENADNKLYGNLGHLKAIKESRPGLKIVVAGCLAQKDKDIVAKKAPYVDMVVGTFNSTRVGRLLSDIRSGSTLVEIWDGPKPEDDGGNTLIAERDSAYSAWVNIQTGCNNNCAFCIVPAVRGAESSRPFGEIVNEVGVLARSGVTEVTLLGQNVNSYGRDLTLGVRQGRIVDDVEYFAGGIWADSPKRRPAPLFTDLLRAIGSISGIRRVRFTSPHPKDIRPETIAAMAEVPSVCEHLHFPLQSGSDSVLARMHRGYDSNRYLTQLNSARESISDLAVTTDIIVGFPGETEADFEATLEVASAAEYDGAFTFIFSPRPGTEAEAMGNLAVAPEVIAQRFEKLKVVIDRSGYAKNLARVGRVEEVMVEGPSKRSSDVWSGRSRQNKLVHFPAPRAIDDLKSSGAFFTPGSYLDVRIDYGAPHFIRGEVVSVNYLPKAERPRILVSSS